MILFFIFNSFFCSFSTIIIENLYIETLKKNWWAVNPILFISHICFHLHRIFLHSNLPASLPLHCQYLMIRIFVSFFLRNLLASSLLLDFLSSLFPNIFWVFETLAQVSSSFRFYIFSSDFRIIALYFNEKMYLLLCDTKTGAYYIITTEVYIANL